MSKTAQAEIMHKARLKFLDELRQHVAAVAAVSKETDFDLSSEERRFHTIKGGAGFFQFSEIEMLAHEVVKACQAGGPIKSQVLRFIEVSQALLSLTT